MNTVIVLLFCVQVVAVLVAVFAMLLVVLPIRRVLSPISRLVTVTQSLLQTVGKSGLRIKNAITRISGSFASIASTFRIKKMVGFQALPIKRLLSIFVVGKQFFGILKKIRSVGQNRFLGTFRLLMLAGPVIIPVLSTIKKLKRKAASAG